MIPSLGAIPSGPDYRDGIALAAASPLVAGIPPLPSVFTTDISGLGVINQKKIPACVSYAWALMMKYWWWRKTGELVDFSPRFLDILSSEPWIPIDGGRVPRTVCKISATIGCVPISMLPSDSDLSIAEYRNPNVITPAMKTAAAKYKIPGYVRVRDETVDDFRRGIREFGLVSGLFAVSDALWLPSWSQLDINPLKAKTSTSGHEMVVNGWDNALNQGRNSWGTAWNKSGDYDYAPQSWLDYVMEGWAIATIPANAQGLLASLPKPSDFSYNWTRDLVSGNQTPDDDVKFAQVALMILGLLPPVAPDQLGYFGPKTEKAVLAYQTMKNVPLASRSQRRIGPMTRGFLNKDFNVN